VKPEALPCVLACALASAALLMANGATAYSTYGLGQLECQTYLDKRGEDQEQEDVVNTSYIHAYLSGYLTAGNTMYGLVGEDAKDVSINIHKMVQWLDAWCLKNRGVRVAVALESFWVEAAEAKKALQRTRESTHR
jgi:hypothetical protein